MNDHASEAGFVPCSLYGYRWVPGDLCAQLRRSGFLLLSPNRLHERVGGFNMRRWDSSYWWRKACLHQSFQVEIMWKILGWVTICFKTWPKWVCVPTHQNSRQEKEVSVCINLRGAAMSCWNPGGKGKSGRRETSGRKDASLMLQDFCGFWMFAIQRNNETETVQRLSKVKTNHLFPNPFPPKLSLTQINPSKQQVAGQGTPLGHLNARFRPSFWLCPLWSGTGTCYGFSKLEPASSKSLPPQPHAYLTISSVRSCCKERSLHRQ